jgi:hypothetical protein
MCGCSDFIYCATESALAASTNSKKGNRMAKQLGPGDPFPNYTVLTVNGGTLNIPTGLSGEYAVIVFYRGIW